MAGDKKYYFPLIAIVAIVAIVGIAFMMNSGGIDSKGIKSNTIGHATNSNSPYGYLDALSCDTIFGWAIDPNNAAPLHIKVYLDSPDNENNLLADILANAPSGDVGPHRFGHAFTSSQKARFQDGKQHTFYVIAIGIGEDGSPEGNNAPLTNSPKAMNCARPPQGYLDVATCDYLAGWAIDPDWSGAISIHFYLDYPAGQGPALTGETANQQRSDVGAHAFHHVFTETEKAKLADGKEHTIYAYAIGKNAGGINDGMNSELIQSPKKITCQNLNFNPEFDPKQSSPITVESIDKISNGRVTIGVSKRYGGAIAYLADNTIGDENIVDNSNAGTLFTTAIWHWPYADTETKFCYSSQMVNGQCPGTIPYHNPTLGGYLGNGWAGNPNNPRIMKYGNERIDTSERMANYNFAYDSSKRGSDARSPYPSESNKNEWQTDFWIDQKITFHPTYKNVVILETNVTYCKDLNTNCKDTGLMTQSIQANTLFGRGNSHPDPAFRGPFTRATTYQNYYLSSNHLVLDVGNYVNAKDCDKAGLILKQSQDVGVGIYVDKFYSTDGSSNWRDYYGTNCKYLTGTWPSILAYNPALYSFDSSGVGLASNGYGMAPGGWFKFKSYIVTGTLDEIKTTLLKVSQES